MQYQGLQSQIVQNRIDRAPIENQQRDTSAGLQHDIGKLKLDEAKNSGRNTRAEEKLKSYMVSRDWAAMAQDKEFENTDASLMFSGVGRKSAISLSNAIQSKDWTTATQHFNTLYKPKLNKMVGKARGRDGGSIRDVTALGFEALEGGVIKIPVQVTTDKGVYQSYISELRSGNEDDPDKQFSVDELIGKASTLGQLAHVMESSGVSENMNGRAQAYSSKRDQGASQFGAQQTFKDSSGNLFFGTTKRNPQTGEVDSVLTPVNGNYQPQGEVSLVSGLGQTADEKANYEMELAGGKVRSKGLENRLSSSIETGVQAADGIVILDRASELLTSIETGGVDAAAHRIKQVFGVEGADEGELSANLGKAVLSQLRSTFGAAFTAKEGEQLKQIEAGFGKSTATNIRLVAQARAIAQRSADRGLRAAEQVGDNFSAEEINNSLSFKLNNGSTNQTSNVGRFTVEVVN